VAPVHRLLRADRPSQTVPPAACPHQRTPIAPSWPPRIIAVTSEIRTGQRQELFFEAPYMLNWPKKQGSSRVCVIHRRGPRDQRFPGTSLTGVALSPRITTPPAKVEATGAVHDAAAVTILRFSTTTPSREIEARVGPCSVRNWRV